MTEVAASPALAGTRPETSQSQLRRLLFSLGVLALIAALCAPLFISLKASNAPQAAGGVVDYRRWGPLEQPVELTGQWQLIWSGGGPVQGPPAGTRTSIRVPGIWTGTPVAGQPLPRTGLATYRLTLLGLRPDTYVLHVPTIFAANRVWVNGKMVSERGRVGPDAASTRYYWRSHEIPIELTGSTLDLAIDIAAFHHRDNGMEAPPVFGKSAPMRDWITLEWAHAFLFVCALMLLAAYGLVVFLFRPDDRASLYFAISCLMFLPTAAAFRYDNLLLAAFPGLELAGMMAAIYLCGLIAVGSFFAYVHALFPAESPRRLFYVWLAVLGTLFVIQAVALIRGDTMFASAVHTYTLGTISTALIYIVGVVSVATYRRRNGAVAFLAGISIFFATFIIASIVAMGLVTRDRFASVDLSSIGMLMLLFSHIVILAERWSMAMDSTEQTNDDLRRLLDVSTAITTDMQLESLLGRIVAATTKIVHADRSSLFLYDDRTDELWSLVAEGVTKREIRLPASAGLAGHSFTHREVVNVKDAYEDPRFQKALDPLTGYRTRSILTVPITTRDGRRLGIMQALNSSNPDGFGQDDIARMTAFAAQAAVAIDNATLFTDVVAERNYNESILRSMSSGVVTLDAEGRVAKLNAAACAIFARPLEDLIGVDARKLLSIRNPKLIAELDAVVASAAPKTLIDVDFTTGRGETISVNISIVPLQSGDSNGGLLVLIEDITEGKRLQGAMRRFMTQSVVDQVLGRGDDLLFGTACEASVLFADVRGFTTLAEGLAPRETVDMLNELFTELFEAVADAGGVLDKYIGDAIMAVYGAPIPTGRDPENAVESALAMLRMLGALNARRTRRQQPELELGIGISSGEVVAGTIGSPKRMDYTVIGDSVNLAARLQAITKHYKVSLIVCERTAAALNDHAGLRELDLIRVRGRRQPEKIFEVMAPDALEGKGEKMLAAYNRGRQLMMERKWKAAAAAFRSALRYDPADTPSAMMRERSLILSMRPPGRDWDGVWETPEAA